MHIVLNWLWQGCIVALATRATLRVMPRSRTQARYALVWAACFLLLALPVAPLVFASVAAPAVVSTAVAAPVLAVPVAWWSSTRFAIAVYTGWFAVSSVRLAAAITALRKARRECHACPSDLADRLPRWSRVGATGRPTRLVISTRVRFAAVLGCGSPLVAVAPILVERLTADDLDRIVVHEWAHVQRYDDCAQLVQLLIRAAVGWHPAVWWLVRQLELEREVACDEIAVAITGSARQYAACLTTVASLPISPVEALPVPGVAAPTGLHRRVVRILAARNGLAPAAWRTLAITASGVLAAITCVVASITVVTPASAVLSLPGVRQLTASSAVVSSWPRSTSQGPVEISPVTLRRSPSTRIRSGKREEDESTLLSSERYPDRPAASSSEPMLSLATTQPLDRRAAFASALPTLLGPSNAPVQTRAASGAPDPPGPPVVKTSAPWAAAADAGAAIGRNTQNAAVTTAGFFTRFGKKIAASF